MMGNNEEKLNDLKNLENQFQKPIEEDSTNQGITVLTENQQTTENKYYEMENESSDNNETVEMSIISGDDEITYSNIPTYETVNGYRVLDNESLPYFGKLYPESWRFSFRCPTVNEVSEFSTIDERDAPKIQDTITNLIKKCYVIVDTETEKQVPTSQINDGDRLFFFLKLREFYMQDMPIEFPFISMTKQEPLQVTLMAHNLIYKPIKEELLKCYDGRKWTIPTTSFGLTEPIVFLNPTLDISQRIFKYMVNKYRETQDTNKTKINKSEFNRKFLLLLPFLYEQGNEKIESLNIKFKQIEKNEKLLKAYITLANKMIHTNEEYLVVDIDGDEERTDIKFPGGWKNLFIDNKSFEKLFD